MPQSDEGLGPRPHCIVDGATFGSVTGLTVNPDGTVAANYSNGLTQNVFKLPPGRVVELGTQVTI